MTDMLKPVQNNNDEIDLIFVLERILRFLSNNKKSLIVTSIVGMICGFIIYQALPKSYGSTLILHSQVLANSEEIAILDSWNTLLHDREYGVLSRNLNCSIDLLTRVKNIAAENIQNTQPSASTGFSVNVLVRDTAVLEELQTAIVYGLESNEYVKEKVNFKRDNTIQMIANLNREIDKLDSTKRKIESSNTVKPSPSPSIIIDISDVNVQMIKLKEKLYEYQETLKFVDAIQILEKFEKYEQPANPRAFLLLISGFLGGLFLGFAMAILKNVRTKIAAIRNTRLHPFPNSDLA